MDPILDAIDEALKRKGLSDAAASRLAVGHPSLLKNLRMPRDGEKRYNLPALMKLAEVLDLEFYFGPPRDNPSSESKQVDDSEFAFIPLHEAVLSAGPGSPGHDEISEHLAFRRDWLRRIGVAPSAARLARVVGDSMSPTLTSGDMVLIDTSKTMVKSRASRGKQRPPIYAFVEDGQARVKRIDRVDAGVYALVSDNPDVPLELKGDADLVSMHIIGKVVWWGHTAPE